MKKVIRASMDTHVKVTDTNWNDFLDKIEKATGLTIDSAYRRRRKGDDWIYLFDDSGNEFAAEITEYTNGEYEFLDYNLIKIEYPDQGVIESSTSTELVDTFLQYHELPDNYNNNPEGFNQVYSILDKYTDDLNEPVDQVFVRATPKDQIRMIRLITPRK